MYNFIMHGTYVLYYSTKNAKYIIRRKPNRNFFKWNIRQLIYLKEFQRRLKRSYIFNYPKNLQTFQVYF